MPIRSQHGRAAAYRALWQWPLHSPRRLAITVIVLLALVAGVAYGLGATTRGPADEPTATGRPGVPRSVPTALPPVAALEPSTLPPSAAPPAALDVAERFTRAWVRPLPGTTPEQWLTGLRPTTTDEYLSVLGAVDPANIPASRVIGGPRAVRVAPRSVQVRMQTDGPTLLVLVVDTGSGWRVAGYDRA